MLNGIFQFGQGKSSKFSGASSSVSSSSNNSHSTQVATGAGNKRKSLQLPLENPSMQDFDSGYQGESDAQSSREKPMVTEDSDDEMEDDYDDEYEYEEEHTGEDGDYEAFVKLALHPQSYTTSLSPSIVNYNYENGRRYHCYKEGEYILPNDDTEQERLDLTHHIFRMILGGELHYTPIQNPERILDLGTGTGIWAIDMADEYPNAHIIANDLSAIQPSKVPPNLTFEIDDCESLWPYSKPFDFIHCRTLTGAIRDWPELYAQAFNNLKPGGWFEASDLRIKTYCVGGHKPGAVCLQLSTLFHKAVSMLGKPPDVAPLHKQFMIDAGFINVEEKIVHIPQNSWPTDKKQKEIGIYQMYNILDAIPSYGIAALTRILGMPRVEAEVLIAAAKAEVQDPSNKFYSIAHFVIGQKPSPSES